ncbi:MAG TPA: DUF116 domain-containing protein [Holophagaceae bacterium]
MTEVRALPAPGSLPEERYGAFLALRRGIPLLVAVSTFLAAALHAEGRGWWMVGTVAGLAAAWPTFYRGTAYLRNRSAIMRWDGLWARGIRPLARGFGREDAWILSFCAWHNHRVREAFAERKARRALILLPHCIQLARCKAGILEDLQACYDCGKCPVGDYMNAALAARWEGRITNRSHKAYREAREYRPDLIVAVSCTDRLLKGLVKLPETPSYVIPLALPHGMCVDTDFSVRHLMAAMEALVQPIAAPAKVQPLIREA